MSYLKFMNGTEFIRKTRKLARKNQMFFDVNTKRGKGSHSVVYYGTKKTICQKGEIPKGTLKGMCSALGFTPEDL
jgi:hypothetical protein